MEDHGRYRLLGQTIDDAAGEAFDKVARFLGLGYPGGPAIDRVAIHGDPTAIAFPRAMLARRASTSPSAGSRPRSSTTCASTPRCATADVAASFQEAVVDVLVHKARRGRAQVGAKGLVLGGGVAANSLLREQAARRLRRATACAASCPSRAMCTDNAAMIAADRLVPAAVGRPEPAGDRRRPQPAPAALAVTGCGHAHRHGALACWTGHDPRPAAAAHRSDHRRPARRAGADGRRDQRALPRGSAGATAVACT